MVALRSSAMGKAWNVILGSSKRPLRCLPRLFHSSRCTRMKLPSSWDLATGLERWEACQHAKGNKDPFYTNPAAKAPGTGTKDCPIPVPSVFNKRHVMCVNCQGNSIIGFVVHEGFPRRCLCNYWFVLERLPLPKIYEDLPDK